MNKRFPPSSSPPSLQSVRQGATDPAIMFTILDMLRGWVLGGAALHLTPKELLVIVQRIAQVGGGYISFFLYFLFQSF